MVPEDKLEDGNAEFVFEYNLKVQQSRHVSL